MTRKIELTQGKVALVDDEDFEWLNMWDWYANKRWNTFYAMRKEGVRAVCMHRVILSAPEGVEVDHRDGDGLNNTRSNLRLASTSQNQANRKKDKDNRSGYKGVSWHAVDMKWQARIRINDRQFYLGRYATPEEAARAYDKAAREYFGEFARTNFQD